MSSASGLATTGQARWARTRMLGRLPFIWRYGVVGWGIPAGMVTSCYHILRLHAIWTVAGLRPLWESIAGLFIACGVVGYLLGAWLWDACESRFGPESENHA